MQVAQAINSAQSVPLQELLFLVLGGNLPMFRNERFHADINAPCAAIILVGPVSAAQLTIVLERTPDPAIPIADFAGNSELRSDFAAQVLTETSVTRGNLSALPELSSYKPMASLIKPAPLEREFFAHFETYGLVLSF